jgi:hypothetical protein
MIFEVVSGDVDIGARESAMIASASRIRAMLLYEIALHAASLQ